MHVKNGMLLLLLLSFLKVQSQVTLTLQVPPAGVVQKSQLWNFVLVNGSTSNVEVQVSLSLLSAADNHPVLTATGRLMTLARGAKQVKYADVSPVQYQYLSSAFNVDLRPEGFLPVGNYIACYTVSRAGIEYMETLAEDCISLDVQALSPPILNFPQHQGVIESRSPQFSWLPPAPLQLFSDLSYDVLITTVSEGQSPASAIQQNRLVYNEGRHRHPFLNYPASNHVLDTGITYAWCVVARNNNQFVVQSDVWTFKVAGPPPLSFNSKQGPSFIQLTRETNMADAICENEVLISYRNETQDTAAYFVVTSLNNTKEQQRFTGSMKLTPGQNFTRLPAAITKQMNSKERYLVELINTRNEHWYSKFQYIDVEK